MTAGYTSPIVAVAAALTPGGHAQTERPVFEAVSVKPGGSNHFVSYGPSAPVMAPTRTFAYVGKRVTCNLSLRQILGEAFTLQDYQIAGPDWIGESLFDVAAVMPAGTTRDTARLMLRAMLEDRFGLKYHREQRELPTYVLVAGNGSSRLTAVDPEKQKDKVVQTAFGPQKGISSIQTRGQYTALAISMDDFARWLTHQADAPVLNQTGLPDRYEIELRWTPETGGGYDPALLRAVQRDLGLRLEKRRMTREVLVIDHVEKTPTEN
jgi:uncharacterized protein (TIGR03435 family)